MHTEFHGRDAERTQSGTLGRFRDLIGRLQQSQVRLLDVKDELQDGPLRHAFVRQAVRRASYANALSQFVPHVANDPRPQERPGSGSSADEGGGTFMEGLQRLWTSVRAAVPSDATGTVRDALHREDERTLELYDEFLQTATEPNLVGTLQRQRKAIQEWTERLQSKKRNSHAG